MVGYDADMSFYLSMFVNFEDAQRSLVGAWKSGKLLEQSVENNELMSNGITVQVRDEIMSHKLTQNDTRFECPCLEHAGGEYINEILNIDSEILFQHLFSEDSDMMRWVFTQRKWEKASYTPFKQDEVEGYVIFIQFRFPLNQLI